jgi:hypothetical protein
MFINGLISSGKRFYFQYRNCGHRLKLRSFWRNVLGIVGCFFFAILDVIGNSKNAVRKPNGTHENGLFPREYRKSFLGGMPFLLFPITSNLFPLSLSTKLDAGHLCPNPGHVPPHAADGDCQAGQIPAQGNRTSEVHLFQGVATKEGRKNASFLAVR